MKLYDSPVSPNCRKVRAVLYELALDAELIPVNILRGDNRAPAFLARNPNGRVPVLEDGDFVLWESNAIIAYLASKVQSPCLLPAGARDRAEVDRWTHWQVAHLGPAISRVAFERVVKPLTSRAEPDVAAIQAGTADYHKHTATLEASLGGKEYVAGRLSVADFALASFFSLAAPCGLEVAGYPKVNAWLGRVLSRDSMKRANADAQAAMNR